MYRVHVRHCRLLLERDRRRRRGGQAGGDIHFCRGRPLPGLFILPEYPHLDLDLLLVRPQLQAQLDNLGIYSVMS